MAIEINHTNLDTSQNILNMSAIILVLGSVMVVNYKLLASVRKETVGSNGKVFQRIIKNYAIIQVFWCPSLITAKTVLQMLGTYYGDLINPCVFRYGNDILIFCYILWRYYVGLNSLILAIGRYAFVVHDVRMLKFGVEKMGKILISLSFTIPLLMAILAESVKMFKNKALVPDINFYDLSCSLSDNNNLSSNITEEMYSSPLYKAVHSVLPSWTTNCLYVIHGILSALIFCNILEGILYVNCARFVFR